MLTFRRLEAITFDKPSDDFEDVLLWGFGLVRDYINIIQNEIFNDDKNLDVDRKLRLGQQAILTLEDTEKCLWKLAKKAESAIKPADLEAI